MTASSTGATSTGSQRLLRVLGALTLLAVGAVHLQQYFAVYYYVVPVIGPLFALNFAGAVIMGVLLLLPTERLVNRLAGGGGQVAIALLAVGGMALAALSIAFLFVSEVGILFGFHEHGYRPAILAALAAEAATIILLGAYLASLARGR